MFTYSRLKKTDISKDLRQARRQSVKAVFQLSWLDESGQLRSGSAELLDISEGGFALHLREAPNKLSRVRYVCNRLKLAGVGQIKNCTRLAGGYRIGVEYLEGSRWVAPAGEAMETREWDWGFSRA